MDFNHVRESRTKLTSLILVEDLLLENKDLYAISLALHSEIDGFQTYNNNIRHSLEESDLYDQKRIAYSIRAHVEDIKNQPHCGDCTSVACSCSRCISEDMYSNGLSVYNEWIDKMTNNNYISLLSVLLASEHKWVKYWNLMYNAWDNNCKNDEKKADEGLDKMYKLQYRYDYWYKLSNDEKELFHIRAVRFRNYLDNIPIVEGVPWW